MTVSRIVATKTFKETAVYGNHPPSRKIQGGDFVADEYGRITHIVSSHNGQGLQFGMVWQSWDAFKSQNDWVQGAIEAQEQADHEEHMALLDEQREYAQGGR